MKNQQKKHYAKMAATMLTAMMAISFTGLTAQAETETDEVVIAASVDVASEENGDPSEELYAALPDDTDEAVKQADIAGDANASASDEVVTDGANSEDAEIPQSEKEISMLGKSDETEGWHQDNGGYYFIMNGERVCDRIMTIGGVDYGFNEKGYMYDDVAFGCSKDRDGNEGWHYYHAKPGGTLFKDTWYDEGNGYWSYYGPDGKGLTGFQTIAGTQYYFSVSGWMYKNRAFTYEGKNYAAANNGVVHELAEGWNDIDGYRYYVLDGEVVNNKVIKIGDLYFGFNDDGTMFDDMDFLIDHYNGSEYEDFYYRAKSGGDLYTNAWYTTDWDETFYYGEDGAAVKGLYSVDGILYLFTDSGELWRNGTKTIDGITYISDEYGVAAASVEFKEGWNNKNGYYYYVKNGKLVVNEVMKTGGAYYGFDYKGRMYDDAFFYEEYYRYDEDVDGTYPVHECHHAKKNGYLYVNSWKEYSNGWRYYDENGTAVVGIATIDGTTYLFDNEALLWRSGVAVVNGKSYTSNGSGVATEIKDDGWVCKNGTYYYVKNGLLVRNQVIKVNGAYYGFDSMGRMRAGELFGCARDASGSRDYRTYYARESGALLTNSWYDEGDYWFDFGANGKAVKGAVTVSGTKYLFDDDGRLWDNASTTYDQVSYDSKKGGYAKEIIDGWSYNGTYYFYVRGGKVLKGEIAEINGVLYGFDDDGRMYASTEFYTNNGYYRAKANGALYRNTWYDAGGGDWYYYGADGQGANEVVKVGGVNYLFNYAGRLLKNTVVNYNGKCYCSNGGGVVSLLEDGWTLKNGAYYYVKNGEMIANQIIKVGNAYYAFNEYGRMYANVEFWLTNGYYRAKASGALYADSWYKDNYGDWYYYGAGGKAATGVTEVGGTKYLFDEEGTLLVNATGTADGKNYYSNGSGVAKELKEGWNSFNGYYAYVKNGKIITDSVVQIDKAYFGFDWNGRMYDNTVFTLDNYDKETGEWLSVSWYRAKKGGYLYVNAWYNDGSDWYYYGEGGRAAREVQYVGNVLYMFDYDGMLRTNAVDTFDGIPYASDENGVATALEEGWNNVGGRYYYVEDGKLAESTTFELSENNEIDYTINYKFSNSREKRQAVVDLKNFLLPLFSDEDPKNVYPILVKIDEGDENVVCVGKLMYYHYYSSDEAIIENDDGTITYLGEGTWRETGSNVFIDLSDEELSFLRENNYDGTYAYFYIADRINTHEAPSGNELTLIPLLNYWNYFLNTPSGYTTVSGVTSANKILYGFKHGTAEFDRTKTLSIGNAEVEIEYVSVDGDNFTITIDGTTYNGIIAYDTEYSADGQTVNYTNPRLIFEGDLSDTLAVTFNEMGLISGWSVQ